MKVIIRTTFTPKGGKPVVKQKRATLTLKKKR